MNLTPDEMIRYSKQIILKDFGINAQLALKNSKVLCIGAGGLGSPLLTYLGAAGIGHLGIVDADIVELSNLQRQPLYKTDDIGKSKINIARSYLQQLNPNLTIHSYHENLTEANALTLISDYDVIADCSDNFTTRYLINDACFHLKKPNVSASVFQFEGQCSVFCYKDGPCYRCLFLEPPPADLIPNCSQAGVLGVVPALLGTLQANEIIKIITGIGSVLSGHLLTVNTLDLAFKKHKIQKNNDCILCQYQKPFYAIQHSLAHCHNNPTENLITATKLKKLLSKNKVILFDIREPFEYQICHINGQLIKPNDLKTKIATMNRKLPIVIHCKSGVRSGKLVEELINDGYDNIYSLKGGILEWINEIDPSLQKY